MYNKKENKDYEIDLIKIVILYMFATEPESNHISVEDAAKKYSLFKAQEILKNELKIDSMEKTIFYFEQEKEHIINTLADKFKELDIRKYKEIIQNVRLKLGYVANNLEYKYKTCALNSIEDLYDWASEIYYMNQSIEELIEESYESSYAKYELACRYYNINENEKAFDLINQAGIEGNKNAVYRRIKALYEGVGVEKNEKQAFNELNELINNNSDIKAITLLGKMYYEGKGVEQNYEKAFEKFNTSCYFDCEATYYLGLMYLYGQGCVKDDIRAKFLLHDSGIKKATEMLLDKMEKEKSEEIDFSVNFIEKHGLIDKYLKEIEKDKFNKLVDDVVFEISKMPKETKATLYDIINQYEEINIKDTKTLLKLTKKINEKCVEKNIIIDYSEHDGKRVGLPFVLTFTKK